MTKYLAWGPTVTPAIAAYVMSRLPEFCVENGRYEALGTVDGDGNILGGIVYTEWRTGEHVCDVRMAVAGQPGWLSKGLIRAYFEYPFCQLGCTRITAIVAKPNKHSRQFAERFGFKLEGVSRKALEWNGKPCDAMIYGLLKENCKWIGNTDGQEVTKAA